MDGILNLKSTCFTNFFKYKSVKKLFIIFFFIIFSCSTNDDSCETNSSDSEVIVCIEIYQPVCGCNNITYSNDCYAGAKGVSSWTQGECSN